MSDDNGKIRYLTRPDHIYDDREEEEHRKENSLEYCAWRSMKRRVAGESQKKRAAKYVGVPLDWRVRDYFVQFYWNIGDAPGRIYFVEYGDDRGFTYDNIFWMSHFEESIVRRMIDNDFLQNRTQPRENFIKEFESYSKWKLPHLALVTPLQSYYERKFREHKVRVSHPALRASEGSLAARMEQRGLRVLPGHGGGEDKDGDR